MDIHYTTGETATLCRVSPQKVIDWVNSGELGFRIPGSRFRRIPREQLIRFLEHHQVPLDFTLLPRAHKVLLVTKNELLVAHLRTLLQDSPYVLIHTTDRHEIDRVISEAFGPFCWAVIDVTTSNKEILQMAEFLRLKQWRLIFLAKRQAVKDLKVEEVFLYPFDAALVSQQIVRLLEKW